MDCALTRRSAGRPCSLLIAGLVDELGRFRSGGVGIHGGKKVIHVAPPAHRVSSLISDLLDWLQHTDEHPLIAGSVFHYEFEFIHPFQDGNGRMGRLWQTLILYRWRPVFASLPVESLIRNNRSAYYSALNACNQAGESTEFIEFMLRMIYEAVSDFITTEQASEQVSEQVERLLHALGNSILSTRELLERLQLSHRPNFLYNYLQPALKLGLIEMTHPDKPRARNQKYRLTTRGITAIKLSGSRPREGHSPE